MFLVFFLPWNYNKVSSSVRVRFQFKQKNNFLSNISSFSILLFALLLFFYIFFFLHTLCTHWFPQSSCTHFVVFILLCWLLACLCLPSFPWYLMCAHFIHIALDTDIYYFSVLSYPTTKPSQKSLEIIFYILFLFLSFFFSSPTYTENPISYIISAKKYKPNKKKKHRNIFYKNRENKIYKRVFFLLLVGLLDCLWNERGPSTHRVQHNPTAIEEEKKHLGNGKARHKK